MGAIKARQFLAAANIPPLEHLVAEIMLPENEMLYRHICITCLTRYGTVQY